MACLFCVLSFPFQLKTFYHKLLEEIAPLRDLWLARVCLSERTEPYDEVLVANYAKAKQQVWERMNLIIMIVCHQVNSDWWRRFQGFPR